MLGKKNPKQPPAENYDPNFDGTNRKGLLRHQEQEDRIRGNPRSRDWVESETQPDNGDGES